MRRRSCAEGLKWHRSASTCLCRINCYAINRWVVGRQTDQGQLEVYDSLDEFVGVGVGRIGSNYTMRVGRMESNEECRVWGGWMEPRWRRSESEFRKKARHARRHKNTRVHVTIFVFAEFRVLFFIVTSLLPHFTFNNPYVPLQMKNAESSSTRPPN